MFMRRRWPFTNMQVDDSVTFKDDDVTTAVTQVRNLERTKRKAGDLWFRVEYPTNSATLVRIIRVRNRSQATKESRPNPNSWPFKNMEVGQSVYFEILIDGKSDKAQTYCHIYGSNSGKRFKTETVTSENGCMPMLKITRIV